MLEALGHAGNALACDDINMAVSHLQEDLGGDKQALRKMSSYYLPPKSRRSTPG